MNKIFTLYNIEIKRIYKMYFALLGFLFAGNILIIAGELYSLGNNLNSKFSLATLKFANTRESLLQYGLINIYVVTNIFLAVAVIFCLIYGILIWYRDFLGKSKTIYTLFMLPENKFKIYIAKAITIIVMIYGVIATQIVSWIIGMNIINIFTNIQISEILNLFAYQVRASGELNLIQHYPIDFVMMDMIGVVLAVIVIFTGVMMQLSSKKKGAILGVLYIVGIIFVYMGSTFGYSDIILTRHIIYYIVVFAISIKTSYDLLNKKIYV